MRVPTYDNFQAQESTASSAPVQGPSGPSAGSIAADQTTALGQGVQRAGDATAQIAVKMQEMANQVRVNDAVNQARQAAQDLAYNPQTGYLNLKGDAALTRPSGQDLPTEYGDKLREQLGKIGGTLGNDEQRRQFQLNANDLSAQFHGQVETHMLGEFREHALSVQNGTIDLASNDAKRNWNNPDLIKPSLAAAQAAVYQKGQVSGWSASQVQAAQLTTSSKVHTDVVLAALENNNPDYALGYLNANRKDMTADDILRVQGHVNQSVWMNMSQGAVQRATQAAMPTVAPTSFDRMAQITAQSESGGRETNPDGSTVTSVKGAKGVMQVMPATNADPGFGVKPAANDSAQERARVGRDYLQAMLQRYGNPAMAWAAYNAGPGAVDKAIDQTKTDLATGAFRGGQPGSDYWLTLLPKETQAYVQTNVKALSNGGGQPQRPTELDFVNHALAQLPAGASPQVVKMTREAAVSQFGVINKSITETGDNAFADAQRWLTQNPNATVEQLPVDITDKLKQFSPGKMDDLVKFSKTLGRGDVVTNNSRYNDIVTNMPDYAKMSDAGWNQMQTELSQVDFRKLSQERANFLNGKTGDTSESFNRAAVTRALNENLAVLKIPVNPGKDADAAARVGGIRKFVDDSIYAAQHGTGKKLTPAEITDHINQLFAANVEFKNTVFGISTSDTATNLMSMQIGDLPSGAADKIRAGLKQTGNKAPTDTDVINMYRKLHAPAHR